MSFVGSGSSLGGFGGGNAIARLLVVISGNTSELEAALAKSEGTLAGFGNNATSIGKSLTRSLTLPLLALGGVSLKMASDFQTSLARVAGLTPLLDQTGQSIQQLGDQIIKLAQDPNINVGPTQLADALYYAGSAGLSAAEAMQVVKLSAEGASVGMGDATDISKILIFALNNFRGTGLTAAAAMDQLTVAIRDGTAAPDEMAIALGRLLPIASAAGLSFGQVTAAVAALSNLGVPTRVATTSLRALFTELLAPTAAATAKLKEFGITQSQLADTMRAGGPVAAFQLLASAVGNDTQAIHAIIPQIRGFTAYLGISGQNLGNYEKILNDTSNSTGVFHEALLKIVNTPAFQFQKGLQSLQIAAIKLGQTLMPIFLHIINIVQSLGDTLANLPKPIMDLFAAFVVLGAAAGPLLQLYGALVATKEATGAAAAAGATAVPTFKALAVGLIAVGIAAIVAFGGFKSLMGGSTSLITIGVTLVATMLAVKLAITGLSTAAIAGKLGAGVFSEALVGLGSVATPVAIGIAALVTVVALFIGRAGSAQRATTQMASALLDAAKSGSALGEALKQIDDSGIAAELTKIAAAKGLLNQPTSIAAPQLKTGLGADLVGQLHGIQAATDTSVKGFDDMVSVIDKAVVSGVDLGAALTAAGFSSKQFFDALTTTGQLGTSDLLALADGAATTALEYGKLSGVIKDFNASEQTSIAFKQLDTAAVQAMATKYGVSVGYMQTALDNYGVSAVGMSDTTQNTFAQANGWVDQASGKIVAHEQEIADATQKMADDMSTSLVDAFTLFGDLPAKATKSLDGYIARAKELSSIAVQQSLDIVKLQKAGVPAGLISDLQAQGPAVLDKFANASKAKLREIVTAYEVGLGAMDAAILKEGAHQETKGKNMVAGFTTAILSNKNLPAAAAHNIVNKMTAAFAAGHLKNVGMKQIQSFVQGGLSQVHLAKGMATRVTNFVVGELISGKGYNKAGQLNVRELIAGLVSKTGVAKSEATKLVLSMTGAMDKEGHTALASGHHIAGQAVDGLSTAKDSSAAAGKSASAAFAQGISSGGSAAYRAAYAVGQMANKGFEAGSKNSPEYYTYYLGKRVMADYYRGIGEQNHALSMRAPFVVDLGNGSRNSGGHTPGSNRGDPQAPTTDVRVTLERRNFSRGLDREFSARGL